MRDGVAGFKLHFLAKIMKDVDYYQVQRLLFRQIFWVLGDVFEKDTFATRTDPAMQVMALIHAISRIPLKPSLMCFTSMKDRCIDHLDLDTKAIF